MFACDCYKAGSGGDPFTTGPAYVDKKLLWKGFN